MPYSTCVRCPDCDGFPCLVHAKADADVIAVGPAVERENVTLLRNARAVALRTNESGTTVTEVIVDRDGERELQRRHDFWRSTEDLPVAENRVTLNRAGEVKLAYKATNAEPRKRLYHQLRSMLGGLGMRDEHTTRHAYLQNPIPVAGVAHQAGTCRFGTDPQTSVLNADCRAHGLDNLYVVDTSCFPSIGAVNPALTVMANGLRVGDHLLERLDARNAVQEAAGAL
jgi:choline dehydrogenase-like flavoprotein